MNEADLVLSRLCTHSYLRVKFFLFLVTVFTGVIHYTEIIE